VISQQIIPTKEKGETEVPPSVTAVCSVRFSVPQRRLLMSCALSLAATRTRYHRSGTITPDTVERNKYSVQAPS
jgi:hypothetical protein